ncbi:N-methylproline demethylase [Labrys sp. WJW]|uniref:NADH:flavin oxidoreductase n=1 Tax=Labrys sp. WJW TaxID=1737983 RepID=UPI00082A1CE9|nr:NADH:flavin oxidoreductase [Labrys sp. WJW]OCC05364.1 N-methylproline demethylase [Labrys sp. WJW]
MAKYQALLKPLTIKNITFRNRIMSTSHAPGYAEDGMPGERYQLYHVEKAKGGIGLTMFGGSSSVALDSPLSFNQISVSEDRVLPYLTQFAERVHAHGAAIMCQITHIGRRGAWDGANWLPLINPSSTREPMHRHYAKEMEDFDFKRVFRNFADAAVRLKKAGLDGCEIIAAAHHLIDAFISPMLNRRTDKYGGSLENRMRFGREVLETVREAVGDDYVLGLRVAGDELLRGGLTQSECLDVITGYCNSGLIDFINVYQAHGDDFRGLQAMIPDMSFASAAFLQLASAVKAEVDIPVFHASAIRDLATASRAVEEGHVDMVAMTRAHIADPHLVRKLIEDREDDVRQCIGANYCIDRGGQGKDALCIQNVVTSREQTMSHDVARSANPRKVVIVGAGPAGLEAARTAAQAGHKVVLFEAADKPGGQLNLAPAVDWRAGMAGIVRWLEMQVRKLGVDLRTGRPATPDAVLAEAPDVVIVATGGKPTVPDVPGIDKAVSARDILSGKEAPGKNVLLFDVTGTHVAATTADFITQRGSIVEIVTPDQMISEEIGRTARVNFMKRLYERNTVMSPSFDLMEVYLDGNALIAVLREVHSDREEEREVDQIIYEAGTQPVADIYFALKPQSRNQGELDQAAFIALQPQTVATNPAGKFELYRIGDAVLSRNVHASMYEAARLVRPL